MLTVACTLNISGGPSSARRSKLPKMMTMQNNGCQGRPTKKQHVHRKQVNKRDAHTTTMCKQRAVSVCPTSAELRTCAQLFSLCCQWPSPGWAHPRGLHWEACTQSDIWTAQEAIIPVLGFFFFLYLLPLFLYHSIYFCLWNSQSVFLPLFFPPLSFHGGAHRS